MEEKPLTTMVSNVGLDSWQCREVCSVEREALRDDDNDDEGQPLPFRPKSRLSYAAPANLVGKFTTYTVKRFTPTRLSRRQPSADSVDAVADVTELLSELK